MWWQRTFVAVMSVVLVGLLACGVWGVTAAAPGPSSGGHATGPPVPAPVVSLSPPAGERDVPPDGTPGVGVTGARLLAVDLVAGDGTPVPGTIAADGHRWAATGALRYGTTYRWSGRAVDDDGRSLPLAGTFSTVDPARTIRARVNIGDGATVGIAAPIIVQFDHHVADKPAAEQAMRVRTSVPTPGSWAWLQDDDGGSRAHWRPRNYWLPGTAVAVTVHQFGVDDGDGMWGREDVTSHFTVGRAQIVKADVNSHQMVVVRDGKIVMNVPASYGLGSDPDRNTTNGVHVVMSKAETVLMSNPAYGYSNVPEHWAVRIQNNGEFIHANPGTTGDQGSENVTHGCVNLSTSDAEAYFETAIFGDPVEVTGSPVPLTLSTGDIADWTVPWSQWRGMSSVRP